MQLPQMMKKPGIVSVKCDAGHTWAYLPEARPEAGPFLPGSPCPLCGFPVARVVVKWESAEQRRLTPRIREDFPEWRPELGACERCLEGYAVREGTWL
ncbi:MAG: hypothetical protein WEF99_06875 [Thermoanaerobaculia bacterium]